MSHPALDHASALILSAVLVSSGAQLHRVAIAPNTEVAIGFTWDENTREMHLVFYEGWDDEDWYNGTVLPHILLPFASSSCSMNSPTT